MINRFPLDIVVFVLVIKPCSFGFSEAAVLVFGLFRPLCPIFLDCISRYTMHFHSLVLSCV